MKFRFLALMTLMMTTALFSQAQGFNRRTVEERVASVHSKLDSAFKLEAATATKVDTVFANYYRQTDKLREELRSGGERPDMQVMREKMQPITDSRDKELKNLLSADQFKKFKEEIEPSMMQRRGGGGGGNRQ